jgi:hypothetical protein
LNAASNLGGSATHDNNVLKIKAKLTLRFSEDILKVEYITADIFIIAFATKIYVYQKQVLHNIITIASLSDKVLPSKEKEPKIQPSMISWSMDILGEELRRLAYVKDKQQVIVQQYEEGYDQLNIKLPWKVQDLNFDKAGSKLVVISEDAIQIFVYSMLKFKNNDQPIQKLWRDR